MTELNQLASAYAGILAVVGLLLGGASAATAVYFYYNPRQSRHRLSYKIFAQGFFGSGLRRIGNVLRREGERTFSTYVDLWNSGAEPISDDVIREPVTIALQSSAVSRGIVITKIAISRETHAGVSNFAVEMDGDLARLNWIHFDPAMGVRVQIDTNEPLRGDEIAVFGQGLRLIFKRIRNIADIGGVPSVIKKIVVIAAPMAGGVFLGGRALSWVASQDLQGLNTYLYFVAVLVFIALLISLSVAAGSGLNGAIDWIFNTRSPIERVEGEPSFRFRNDEDRLAYIEEMRAERAYLRHRAEEVGNAVATEA